MFYEMMEFWYNSFMYCDWEGCSRMHLLVCMYTRLSVQYMYYIHVCSFLRLRTDTHALLNFLEVRTQSVIRSISFISTSATHFS